MQCAACARETNLGEAYALPRIVRAGNGFTNLYACSRACRDQWQVAQAASIELTPERDAPEGPLDPATAGHPQDAVRVPFFQLTLEETP